jgi:AcrR family transcriptional regulator
MVALKIIHVIIHVMKMTETKRSYQMSKRAESAAQTERDIFAVTVALWRERPLGDITLEDIAERAGISTRTIIRRYGSKEGLFETCVKYSASDQENNRDQAKVGDIEDIIHCLLTDYEIHGDAMIRTLASEEQLEVARRVLETGRQQHRAWCEKMFAPYLPAKTDVLYEQELLAFIAATELYLWKLLRRDLKHSLSDTRRTFMRLVTSLTRKRDESA